MSGRTNQLCLWTFPILVLAQNETIKNNSIDDHSGGVQLASWRWEEYDTIITFTVMFIVAGVLKLAFHHMPKLSRHLPESCALIIIGMVVGALVYYGTVTHSNNFPQFTASLFFNVLLPPIILDSAFALYDRDFLDNFASILLYAVVGTLFNVFAIGGMLYLIYNIGAMGSFPYPLDAISCLTFSSLISAVDPVAVLAIFEEISVNMRLYFLVFGESLLNDGVTVVLYNTMIALSSLDSIDYMQYILAFFSFFTVVLGGLAIGIITGAASACILKFTEHVRVIEPLIVIASAYFAFIMAECIHWSGIISLIGCGLVQRRYAFLNISKKSHVTIQYGIKTLASLCDCVIFLFLGIVTFSYTLKWHTGFVLWTILLCSITRFIGVFGLTYLINLRRIRKITYKEQFIMAYGGLRGAVGFSLVTILPGDDQHPLKDIFLTTTLVMVFFTVFVQGGSIKFLVSKFKITKNVKEAPTISEDVNMKTIDYVMAGVESVTGHLSRYSAMEKLRNFDGKYLKRLLVRENAVDVLALRLQDITIDEHYARLYGPTVVVHEKMQRRSGNRPSPSYTGYTEAERQLLRRALANTPFELLRHNAYVRHSKEHVRNWLKRDHEDKMRQLEQRLILARQQESRKGPLGTDDEESAPDGDGTDGHSIVIMSEKNKILWQKAGLSAMHIKRQYLSAKNEYKGKQVSTCLHRGEQETKL